MGYSMREITRDRMDILCAGKPIGRICQHVDGSWIGVIGKYITVRGLASPKQAFNEAVAKHLRYDDSWKKERSKAHKPRKSAPTAKPAIMVPVMHLSNVQAIPQERFTATRAFMRPRSYQLTSPEA